jgi:hypothetical protein
VARFAVFVDAGYFWVQTISAVIGTPHGVRADVIVDFPKLHDDLLDQIRSFRETSDLLRVYWYDGPGPRGKGSDHVSIDELDDFKLRLGVRNNQGQQKAVDGLIIADILSLAQSKAIDTAFLISGDADLAPGVIAAQALGLRVHIGVLAPKSSTSHYLASEADKKFYFPQSWALGFARLAGPSLAAATPEVAGPRATPAVSSQSSDAARRTSNWIGAVAARVHSSLQSSPQASLLADIPKGKGPLPQQIDGQLLFAGRGEIGRALTEDEKRSLRTTFKGILP